MRFRRGDIVWARVLFPKKWWPGLVRSIDGHKVAVSFFNAGEDPQVFLETEVISFEENFESLSKTLKNCSRGEKLLDCALKLLARRAACGLKCACHFRPPASGGKISNRRRDGFRPEKLLSLVHGLAVSAFVGDSDFVRTVTMASQLHVFRRYLVAERKIFVDSKATKERLKNFPLPITGACSIAQSSEVSKLGFESLNPDIPAPPESYPSNPTKSPGLKRHYDHSVESDIHFKLCKTMPLSSINKIHADTERSKIERTICGLESKSQISMPWFSDLSLKLCNRMPLSFSNCIDSVVQNSSRCEENTESFDKVSVEAPQSENAIKMDHNRENHNISIDTRRLESSNATFGFKESFSIEKRPKVDKQCCQFLYMKFPKDFTLPSKKDLVRKFRGFGQINLVKTKVFERLGSAQVVFVQDLDALAAYQYAKKKKSLFAGANVLFWLDPNEKKRIQSKFVVASMPKLKSCLKNLHSGGQEDEKRPMKVRFRMQS